MALSESTKSKIIKEDKKYRAKVGIKPLPIIEMRTDRNRVVAAILAIFLGSFGIHKFYLGKPVQGIIYFLFSWTFIPAFLGIIEGIRYLLLSDQSFKSKYN